MRKPCKFSSVCVKIHIYEMFKQYEDKREREKEKALPVCERCDMYEEEEKYGMH